jgi:hypothetical protein
MIFFYSNVTLLSHQFFEKRLFEGPISKYDRLHKTVTIIKQNDANRKSSLTKLVQFKTNLNQLFVLFCFQLRDHNVSVSRRLLGCYPDLQPSLDQAHRSQRYSTYPVHLSQVTLPVHLSKATLPVF